MRALRFVLEIVVGGLALACAAASALAVVGASYVRLDLLAHFAPLYVLAAVGLVVVALLLRLAVWVPILAGVVTMGAGAFLIAPEFARSTGADAPAASPGQIKVIQFNALATNRQIGRIANWLDSQDADLVTITEARADLRDLLVSRGWVAFGGHSNLMVFTRRPLLDTVRPIQPPSLLTFVNATYATSSGPMEVVTTHLDWPSRIRTSRQRRALTEVVAERPRGRMILTGDFNATPWSPAFRRLDDDLGLIRRDRAVPTYPATVLGRPWPLPILPIDHVYAGPGWRTVSVRRGPWLGSDHYPLVVVLAPTSPPGQPSHFRETGR